MLRRQRGGEGAAPSPGEGAAPSPGEQQLLADAQRCLQEAAILLPPKVGPMGCMRSRGGVGGGSATACRLPASPAVQHPAADQLGTLVPLCRP